MKRDEIRLECLKLAIASCREYTDQLGRAKAFEEFVIGAPEENQGEEVKASSPAQVAERKPGRKLQN